MQRHLGLDGGQDGLQKTKQTSQMATVAAAEGQGVYGQGTVIPLRIAPSMPTV